MMNYTRPKTAALIVFIIIAASAIITACKKKSPPEITTLYTIRMTDSPGDYEEVNIDLVGAEVHSDTKGWITLDVHARVYNLLELTNGVDVMIASGQVNTGVVSQVRLILGEHNTVKINGKVYPLETPSADQSGLKLNVHQRIDMNTEYNLKLDFDAGRSVVATGNDTYKLKPVIRTVVGPVNGSIRGALNPANIRTAVYAINGTDTCTTYSDTQTGYFMVQGLFAGHYDLMMVPPTPYVVQTIPNIKVKEGSATDMGVLSIR